MLVTLFQREFHYSETESFVDLTFMNNDVETTCLTFIFLIHSPFSSVELKKLEIGSLWKNVSKKDDFICIRKYRNKKNIKK